MSVVSNTVSKFHGAAVSIGMLPGTTCRPDCPCFDDCYARRGRFKFKNVTKSLAANTLEWKNNPEGFTNKIRKACAVNKYLRYFHAGDIPDVHFIDMMYRVAVEIPTTRFLCFTKKFEMVNEYIDEHGKPPKNLKIVLSTWGDDFMPDNPHNLPMAYIRLKNGKSTIPPYAKPCAHRCDECIMNRAGGCWSLEDGEAVVFEQS